MRRFFKTHTGSIFRAIFGRRLLARLSRYLLNEARLDSGNDMRSNGEHYLQAQVLKIFEQESRLQILDIGANKGGWSNQLMQLAGNRALALHCFEPSTETAEMLRTTLSEYRDTHHISVVQKALSDQPGTAEFYVLGAGLGTNSLQPPSKHEQQVSTESVEVSTVDLYLSEQSIHQVHLMKVDAEGFDAKVISGALQAIQSGKIDFIQFEYNWRWIETRAFLKDIFDQYVPQYFVLGKITSKGIEFYNGWTHDLESFTENNYLLCKPEHQVKLKSITWWNE